MWQSVVPEYGAGHHCVLLARPQRDEHRLTLSRLAADGLRHALRPRGAFSSCADLHLFDDKLTWQLWSRGRRGGSGLTPTARAGAQGTARIEEAIFCVQYGPATSLRLGVADHDKRICLICAQTGDQILPP